MVVFFCPVRYHIPMNYLIDGTKIAQELLVTITQQTEFLAVHKITPKLVVVLVGDDQASQTYVKRKQMAATKCGIVCEISTLPSNTSQAELITHLETIQKDPELSGVIVQLPLPEPLYTAAVLNAIKPEYDIDGLTNENLGKLMMNQAPWLPPTPAAVLEIIKSQQLELVGKNIVIFGAGALVGKPLAVILMNARASVTTINSRTTAVMEKCLAADIIISGVGKANLIRGNMVKPNALVIDAGVSFETGKMTGDATVDEIVGHAFITPTPGGVGPITVAKLLANTIAAAAEHHQLVLPNV